MAIVIKVLLSTSVACFMLFIIPCTAASCPVSSFPSCNCSNYSKSLYKLMCPEFQLTVTNGNFGDSVYIECTRNDGVRFGDNNEQTLKSLSHTILADLTRMITVTLHCNIPTLPEDIFWGSMSVNDISLMHNALTTLPELLFRDCVDLLYLDVSFNHITDLPDRLFSSTVKMKTLKLNNNQLTIIRNDLLSHLEELQYLYLEDNRLTHIGTQVFTRLFSLNVLNISSNKITNIMVDLFVNLKSLTKIDLHANEFESMPQNLYTNKAELKTINLDNLQTLKSLPHNFLADLTHLQEVKLHSCNMTTLPEDLLWGSESIASISLNNNALTTLPALLFQDCEFLETVDASFNQLTNLPDELFSNKNFLEVLKLNNNAFTTLPPLLLRDCVELLHLDISFNQLTDLPNEFFYNQMNLEVLRLNNNALTTLPALLFRDCVVLEILDASFNQLTDLPDKLLSNKKNLEVLRINNNAFTTLPELLFRDCVVLEILDASFNYLTDLPDELFSNKMNLEFLRLNNNAFTTLPALLFRDCELLETVDASFNQLTDLPDELFSNKNYLEVLRLNNNVLTTLPALLFRDCVELLHLDISFNQLTDLPDELFYNKKNLEVLKLNNNAFTTLPSLLFRDCVVLEIMDTSFNQLTNLPDELFSNKKNLEVLRLNNNAFTTLPELLFRDCVELLHLDISFNLIRKLPNRLFFNTKKLKTLKLNNNQLTVITDNLFTNLAYLEVLSLENNRLTNIGNTALVNLYLLKEVNLNSNLLTFQSNTEKKNSLLFRNSNLQKVQLANNSISKIFTEWRKLKSLKYLNLAHNTISQMKTEDFNFTGTENMIVDLRYNNISEISIFNDESVYRYAFKTKKQNVPFKHFRIEGNPINCDCTEYTFLQYYGDQVTADVQLTIESKADNLQCVKSEEYAGQVMELIPIKYFTCLLKRDYSLNCPEQCSCLFRPTDKALIIDCAKLNLTSMPEALPGLEFSSCTELNLSGNKIQSVKPPLGQGYHKVTKFILSNNEIKGINLSTFSYNLQVLELDGNEITHFNESLTKFFKNAKNFTELTLHRNPWSCDCTTKDIVTVIEHYSKKIKLFENITCENGTSILNLSQTKLCPEEKIYTLDVVVYISFTVAALGISFALYLKFTKEIKVWLYAYQFCLWYVSEEDLDKDKLYDAFVSYSQRDEDFIIDHLVPGLENGPIRYKLCLHQRDWLVGDFIPTQIIRSVEESRRTLIILSQNFLGSEWGKMEFRAAHKQALRERRIRVIIILYGDIGSTDDLDCELRVYLKMNTYIKWGDPLFWEKLRYALPHSSHPCKDIPLQETRRPELEISDISSTAYES